MIQTFDMIIIYYGTLQVKLPIQCYWKAQKLEPNEALIY